MCDRNLNFYKIKLVTFDIRRELPMDRDFQLLLLISPSMELELTQPWFEASL